MVQGVLSHAGWLKGGGGRLLPRIPAPAAVRFPARFERPLRVVGGVAILWVLNALDLLFTQEGASRGGFTEVNLLAAPWVHAPALLTVYKLLLVAVGTAILLHFRRQGVAEAACWSLVGVYAAVFVVWSRYHDYVEICLNDPATVRPPLIF